MARVIIENVLWTQESICPRCGNALPRRGGTSWSYGKDNTEAELEFYSRTFDGTNLCECYTCPQCGSEWEINYPVVREWHTSDGVHRIKRHASCKDIEWGEQTVEYWGKGEQRVYVEMVCRDHHESFFGVFALGSPSKSWDEPEEGEA